MSLFSTIKKKIGLLKIHTSSFTENDLNLHLESHYGFVSQPTCFAYDPFNRILAFGCFGGIVKLQGKPGINVTLVSKKYHSHVINLVFVPESEHLVVTFQNSIEVWSLTEYIVDFSFEFEEGISCINYSHAANVLYIGLLNGNVKVISTKRCETWNITNYTIDIDKANLKDEYRENPSVVAVLSNPKRDDIIVVGYESGVINEWDIKEKKVLRSYLFEHKLITMDWNAKGTKILAGYDNGEIAIWRHKKQSARKIYFPKESNEQPIKKIICTTIRGDKAYFILGGTNETNMITIDTGKDRNNIYLCRESQEIRDFLLIYKDPRSKRDPKYIISITHQGVIDIHILSNNIVKYLEPQEILYPNLNNTTLLSYSFEIDQNFYEQLQMISKNTPRLEKSYKTPIDGGEMNKLPHSYNILVTLNSNGKLYIWNISLKSCISLMYTINIPSEPSCFIMCPYSRRIIVGCLNGDIFIFDFLLSDVVIETTVNTVHEDNSNIKTETNDSPLKSVKDANSYKKMKSSSNLKQSKPEINVNLVSDSSNSFVKSKSENVLAADNKIINQKDIEVKDIKSEQSDDSKNQDTNNNEDSNQNNENLMVENNKIQSSSGFVLSKYFTTDNTVTSLSYENYYNLLAIGSSEGEICVLDITNDTPKTIFEKKIESNKIVRLEFVETMVKDIKQFYLLAFTENGSIIPINLTERKSMKEIKRKSKFLQSFITDFKGKTMMIRKKLWKEDGFSLKYNTDNTLIKETSTQTNEKPSLIDKKSEIRKKLLEKSQSLRNKESNINSHDEEMSIIGKESWNIEKFLIFCTENELCIFTLPQFKLIQKLSFVKPMKFFGKASKHLLVNDEDLYESIIYTIDEEMNLHVLTLMDLRNISADKPINLIDYGIKDISTLYSIKGSYIESGKVILLSERSETFLLNLFYDDKNIKEFLPKLITIDSTNLTVRRKSTFREVRSALGSKKELNLRKIFVENDTKVTQKNIKGKDDAINKSHKADQKLVHTSNDNQEIKEILSDTKEKLNERGKKLEKLSEKTECLQNESQTFADLARQLLEKSKK